MKAFIIIFLFSLPAVSSCKKNDVCQNAEITHLASACNEWSIKMGKNIYPSNNIPEDYRQLGLKVCVAYTLYEDYRLCPCCGGTWANIKSIEKL